MVWITVRHCSSVVCLISADVLSAFLFVSFVPDGGHEGSSEESESEHRGDD